MARLSCLSMIVMSLVLAAALAVGGLGLAVREGLANEVLLWFPPSGKYQLIVRIGPDAPPWGGRGTRAMAVNVWAHGRGTDWHIIRLLGIPLGSRSFE